MKRNYHKVTIIFGAVIVMLVMVFAMNFTRVIYLEDEVVKQQKWVQHMEVTTEGDIYDRNGEPILNPEVPREEDHAYVEHPFSYLLGYNYPGLGQSGLREVYHEHLYDDMGTKKGGSVQLTIDKYLQTKAYELLKNDNLHGTIIVLDVPTGEVLTMASRRWEDIDWNPVYDKNDKGESYVKETVADHYNKYAEMEDMRKNKTMLLDPAITDNDAPGSVYKIITACCAIENGLADFTYTDTGSLDPGGSNSKTVYNHTPQAFGEIGMQSALTNSVNTYFAALSLELGDKRMQATAENFLIGETIDFPCGTLYSSINLDGTRNMLAHTGYGQGKLQISPMHLAMIGQAIANNGEMYFPVIEKSRINAKGRVISETKNKQLCAKAISPETAATIKSLMNGVVNNSASITELRERQEKTGKIFYAKSGTAELIDNQPIYHSSLLTMTDDYVVLVSINYTNKQGSDYAYLADSIWQDLYVGQ